MGKKPSSWDDCEILARDESELNRLLRVRLIQLAFTQDNATSIRAIEQLSIMSSDFVEDDYGDIPTAVLIELRERANEFIIEAEGRDNGADGSQ